MPPGSSTNEFDGFTNNNGYPYASDQFNPGFKNFAIGQPANQMPPDFSGAHGNGQFMPQQRMPRQSKLPILFPGKSSLPDQKTKSTTYSLNISHGW